MDVNVTRFDDELQHWGIKGQRWGVRRYQNSDGTLTAAGKKRYNKELEKLKAEEEKVKAAEKVAANKKRTQTKIDKLDAKRQELEQRKLALKGNKGDKKAQKALEEAERKKREEAESLEEKRERLLKSTDASELYKNKDLLTYNELNERINRIDLETRLASKIVVEQKKTGMDYVNSAKKGLDTAVNVFKSVDSAYSTFTKSDIGKKIMDELGIEQPKKTFSLKDFASKIDEKSDQEIADKAKRIKNQKTIMDALGSIGSQTTSDAKNGMNKTDIQSMIDDAIDEAIQNLRKDE